MISIPLDLQRRFEQRWAARFLRPTPPTAPETHPPERQDQPRQCLEKPKEKGTGLNGQA